MKKTYILPAMGRFEIETEKMMAQSNSGNEGVTSGKAVGNTYNADDVSYAKRGGKGGYDVWEEDWSR